MSMSERHCGLPRIFVRTSRCLVLCAVALCAGSALAADAALNWASLSGEQQYILSGYAKHWATLDLTARRKLLARADVQSMKARPVPGTASAARPADKSADKTRSTYKSSRRRRNLSSAEAALSAHSLRLRRALRELPGLSINERRVLLSRWSSLSAPQRLLLVDRYVHNADDEEELRLQAALDDGSISKADLARGLASGKLDANAVKDALGRGNLSVDTIKEGIASHGIAAEHVERVMRDGDIESDVLSNAIDHNRAPAATPASATAR